MDALIFISIALFIVLKHLNSIETAADTVVKDIDVEDTTRTAKLNETFYQDENAFSEMINALGFPKGYEE